MNKMLLIFLAFLVLLYTSCTKTTGDYYNYPNPNIVFQGNAIDYLQTNGEYDSMVYVLNRLPNLIDSLKTDSVTVFAVPNQCFSIAIKDLNDNLNTLGKEPMYLKDIDTAILDTLISSYFFDGVFTADSISKGSNGYTISAMNFDNFMHIQYSLSGSAGYTKGGSQVLTLSDMNSSSLRANWQNATTHAVNIRVNNGIVHVLESNHEFGFTKLASKVIFKLNEDEVTDEQTL